MLCRQRSFVDRFHQTYGKTGVWQNGTTVIPEVPQAEGTGLEQVLETSGKSVVAFQGAAKSGAVGAHSAPIDADLRAIIDAWPMLLESTKAEILAIVTHSTSVADNGT